jgi:tRNA pseudouridine38-40 synthase
MQRIALGIEYDGSRYSGWQRQTKAPSVQATIENALSKVADEAITVFCAGRTDAGVHAYGQVIHFDTASLRNHLAWVRGANTYLPKDIRVLWCKEVPGDFDARRSAFARQYRYVIYNREISPGIMHQGKTWVFAKLNIQVMQEALHCLLGEHDFTSFRAAECQAKTAIRCITHVDINQMNHYITISITANAFLHHMVRNIVGTLVQIGKGNYAPDWMNTVLQAKDRRKAGMTAPPNGLYLERVSYDAKFELPSQTITPWIF